VIVEALLVAGVVAGLTWSARAASRTEQKRWRALAGQLHLTYEAGSGTHQAYGELRGFPVRIKGTTGKGASVVVTVSGHLDPTLKLTHQGAWTAIKKLFGGEEVVVGDAHFDDDVEAHGPEVTLLAMLNLETRDRLRALIESGVSLEGGTLRFERSGQLRDSYVGGRLTSQALIALVKDMVWVMTRFRSVRDHVPRALAENAIEDGEPDVRRRNLNALAQRYRNHPETERAAQALLVDADPALRVQAAILLPGAVSEKVLRDVVNTSFVPEVRLAAFNHLEKILDAARFVALTRSLLDTDEPIVRQAAVLALGRLKDAASLERIAELGRSEPLAEACATALGLMRDARAQPALLGTLANGSLRAQVAAANALAEVGTIEAVAPLLALAGGLLTIGPLKEASRTAVRAIQSRLGDAEAGRLSLSETDLAHGAVSVVPKTEGTK